MRVGNAAGRTKAELAELEATSRSVYDAMGDRVSATDPEDRIVSWIYDLRRRMVSETRGGVETTAFGHDPGCRS